MEEYVLDTLPKETDTLLVTYFTFAKRVLISSVITSIVVFFARGILGQKQLLFSNFYETLVLQIAAHSILFGFELDKILN